MTVGATTARLQYAGNGITHSFGFPVVFIDAADIEVTLWNAAANENIATTLNGGGKNDYAVLGAKDPASGEYEAGANVVFNSAPIAGWTVTLFRAPPITQLVGFTANDPLPAAVLNTALDKRTMVEQWLADQLTRALAAPETDPPPPANPDMHLPAVATRAAGLLGFDLFGRPVIAATIAQLQALFVHAGAPSPPGHYDLDVTAPIFGAAGDSNHETDDSIPINAAILAAQNFSIGASGGLACLGVYIPDAPVPAGGGLGFYNLLQPLLVRPRTRIRGQGARTTILSWHGDCHGITPFDPSVLTAEVHLEGFVLLGHAPSATVADKTIGINVLAANHWLLRDLYVENFVDALVFDTGDVACAMHMVENFTTYNTPYPNPINGYPRYGLHLVGQGGHQVQCVQVLGATISGNLSASQAFATGDGVRTSFNFQPNAPLWQESGVKVYFSQAGGQRLKQSSAPGADYQLFDFTTGSNVLIPNGSAGSGSQNVNIVFTTPPPAGQQIIFSYNDPYLAAGILAENATANSMRLYQIQGAQVAVDDVTGPNLYDIDNIEIVDRVWKLNGTRTVARCRNLENITIDELYSSTTGDHTVGDEGAGWEWSETLATASRGTQTFTSGSPNPIATDASSAGLLTFTDTINFSVREVETQFVCGLTNSAGGNAQAQFTLQASYDAAATWTTLLVWNVSGWCAPATTFFAAVSQSAKDRSALPLPTGGGTPTVNYRVLAALVAGTNVTIPVQSSQMVYALRARGTNRIIN